MDISNLQKTLETLKTALPQIRNFAKEVESHVGTLSETDKEKALEIKKDLSKMDADLSKLDILLKNATI